MAKPRKKEILAQVAAIKQSLTGTRPAKTARFQLQMVQTCQEISREIRTERDARLVHLGYRLHLLRAQAHWDAFYSAFIAYRNKQVASASPATPILKTLAGRFSDNRSAIEYLDDGPQVGPIRVFRRGANFVFEDTETGESRKIKETSILTLLSRFRRRPNKLTG